MIPAAVLLSIGACDSRAPIAPGVVEEPIGPISTDLPRLLEIGCTANRLLGTVTCGDDDMAAEGIDALIVGGQNQYVSLSSSGVAYDSGTDIFSFQVAITNLIPQPLGTTDGETPAEGGVRVVFHSPPTVTTGTGVITITNASGTGTFTGSNQAYFEYSGEDLGETGILPQFALSAQKTWSFNVPDTVEAFDFLVYVVADVPHPQGYVDVTPLATLLMEGDGTVLSATVRSAVGNAIEGESVTWSSANETVATVDGGIVSTLAPGVVSIVAEAGARSGEALLLVCPDLTVGGVYTAEMPEGAAFCLGGADEGREYVVVPLNLSESANTAITFSAGGIIPVTGLPTPMRSPIERPRFSTSSRLVEDELLETRLRRMERRDLTALLPSARATMNRGGPVRPRFAITPGVPAVGDLMTLNGYTDDACTTNEFRTGRVAAIGTHIIILADTLNPSNGLSTSDYEDIADRFDNLVYPALVPVFGEPTDIDNNDRVIAFYTTAVNALTPVGSSSVTGGFVFSRDLIPAAQCSTSNVGEMFYMLAADPDGTINGNARTVDFVKSRTIGTLGHEFQHLINAARRIYINNASTFEDVWMDEGLAHIAEELLFYEASALSAKSNLGIAEVAFGATSDHFFEFAESNFGRLRRWLLEPEASGPFQDDDDLATRGAAWAFLRYVADREAADEALFWNDLVNSQVAGLENLEDVLGGDPSPLIRDFTIATYLDDAGLTVLGEYTSPSWNFREIFTGLDYDQGPACSCAYELITRESLDDEDDEFTLMSGGGAAFARMGVAADGFAGVTITSGEDVPPATIQVAIIRRK